MCGSHPAEINSLLNCLFFSPDAEKEVLTMEKSRKNARNALLSMVSVALLMALYVVLSQFLSIRIGSFLKIGFAFFPAAVAARLFGPAGGIAVYALGDMIGGILFPTGGAYYPGFTLTYVLMGLVYGIFLYRKSSLLRVTLAAVVNMGLFSFLLNSFWLSRLYGSEFTALLATRWPQSLGMCVVQIVVLSLVLERLCRPIESKLFKGSVYG